MTTYNVTYSNIINHSKKRNHTTNSLAISDEEKAALFSNNHIADISLSFITTLIHPKESETICKYTTF